MKIHPLFLAALVSGAATVLFTGCSTMNTVEPAEAAGNRQMVPDKRVITDPVLNRHVRILSVNAANTPAGFLKIQIEIMNVTSSPQSFNYRVEWFDENGMLIELPTNVAIPRTIEGKETMDLVAIAPKPAAKDFRVKFLDSTN